MELYYNRGIAYYEKREYDKAIAEFSEVIKRNPNHVDAYYNRGNAYWDKVDFDEAIADFSMAVKLEPEYAEAHGYRADLPGPFRKGAISIKRR